MGYFKGENQASQNNLPINQHEFLVMCIDANNEMQKDNWLSRISDTNPKNTIMRKSSAYNNSIL